MQYNLNIVGETYFGKFLSCALMANPADITDHDLTKLDLNITLDGKLLNLQAVFSAFEQNITNGSIQQRPPRSGPSAGPPPSQRVLESLRDGLHRAQEGCGSVNSVIESHFSRAIEAAQDVAGEHANVCAREAVHEAAWDHSPGDCVVDEVWSAINDVIEEIDAELER